MWKSKKPAEEREPYLTQKEELVISPFEASKPTETGFEPRPTPAKEEPINIGKSISIKGELTGEEDLTIDGRVEGKIELKDHDLVIGSHGTIVGEISARNLTVKGGLVGNICAGELVEIKASGSVVGDVESSRISIADGAYFKGSVDVRRSAGTQAKGAISPSQNLDAAQDALAGLQAI
jgi:cytoskeletal protein CcmA (bactofilin family)